MKLSHISQNAGGGEGRERATNKVITQESSFLGFLDARDVVLADHGFNVQYILGYPNPFGLEVVPRCSDK